MDSGILSTQLEKLPAYGLTLELKGPVVINGSLGLSYILSLVYLLFFLLLLSALYLLPLSPLFSTSLGQFFCLAVILVWYCRQLFNKHFLLKHPFSIQKLVFTELGWCYVELKNSQIFKADICSDTILTEHLVILNLTERAPEELCLKDCPASPFASIIKKFRFFNKYSVLLTADRLDSNKFREIKRHLRLISFSKNSHLK